MTLDPLLLLAAVLCVGRIIFFYHRARFNLGDFCVMIWLTGLVMGLTAKFVSDKWSWRGLGAFSIGAGLVAFALCTYGLEHARKLGAESFARRTWLQARAVLLLVPVGLIYAAVHVITGGNPAWRPYAFFAGGLGLVGLIWMLLTTLGEAGAGAARRKTVVPPALSEKNGAAGSDAPAAADAPESPSRPVEDAGE